MRRRVIRPQIVANVIEMERRPPAYHVGLWAWLELTDSSERMARLYSAFWIILLVPATYQLARSLADERSAVFAALLAATAPVLINYGQIIRYYSMVAALSACRSRYSGVSCNDRASRGSPMPWLPWRYCIATIPRLAWWPHKMCWPCSGGATSLNIRAGNGLVCKRCWPVMVLLWVPVVLLQGTRDFGAADLSNSVLGSRC